MRKNVPCCFLLDACGVISCLRGKVDNWIYYGTTYIALVNLHGFGTFSTDFDILVSDVIENIKTVKFNWRKI